MPCVVEFRRTVWMGNALTVRKRLWEKLKKGNYFLLRILYNIVNEKVVNFAANTFFRN